MSAVNFTTYFGDYFLGMFVEWNADASATSGTTLMTMNMTMNMRSKLHVYGYSGNTADSTKFTLFDSIAPLDAEATWKDTTSLFNEFINYYAEDAGTTIPGRPYPYDSALTAATAFIPAYVATTEQYHHYLAWANPDTSGSVTFDGIEVKSYLYIQPRTVATNNWTSLAELVANPPYLRAHILDNATTTQQFDIHPGSAYASGDSVEDVVQSGANNVLIAADYSALGLTAITDLTATGITAAQNICTETWQLSYTALTCVEMVVKVGRYRNTGDTLHDINLDLTQAYQMHAAIGRTADTSDVSLQFAAQEVNFAQTQTAGAFASASSSAGILAAIIYSMAF